MNTPTAHDIITLAETAYGEDRGDGFDGMVAVCFVAKNRADVAEKTGRKQFGDGSLAAACLAPEQFACWLPSDPNRAKIAAVTLGDPSYQLAMLAALMVVAGRIPDPTNGALFYYADSIEAPYWAEGRPSVSIGHQKYIA